MYLYDFSTSLGNIKLLTDKQAPHVKRGLSNSDVLGYYPKIGQPNKLFLKIMEYYF